MNTKKIVVYSISLLVISACLFYNCKTEVIEKHVSHYVDTTVERNIQIEKCGSCHKTEYENWKIGPHANAFLALENHATLLDSSRNFPKDYDKFVDDRMQSVCMACHTGQNVYETNFAGINHTESPHSISKDSMPNVFKQAFSRDIKNKKQLASGVDCITCHVQKDQVVTHASSKASDTLGLVKSNFFSDNMNCYSCHHHQVTTMKELVQKKVMTSEISCINCHQEYSEKGRRTHYFYWRNDHASKKRPKHLDIFECVKLSFNKSSLLFNWTNTIMPHGFSECGDAKCEIIAVDKHNKKKLVVEQLINRKDFFDERKEMPPHFHIGKNGNRFDYNAPILQEVELKNYSEIDHFIIIGYFKPQYWSADKEFIQVFKKEISSKDIL